MIRTLTLPNLKTQSWLIQFTIALAATALLTLSAKIQIPMYPVNTTLQSLAIILLGATLGKRLGLLTVALYLIEGASGLPVFTSTPDRGIGLAYMAGPTGGYLAGFLAAVYIAGSLAEKGWSNSFLKACALGLASLTAIYVPGYLYLAALTNASTALSAGVLVFLPAAFLTVGLGAGILAIAGNLKGTK